MLQWFKSNDLPVSIKNCEETWILLMSKILARILCGWNHTDNIYLEWTFLLFDEKKTCYNYCTFCKCLWKCFSPRKHLTDFLQNDIIFRFNNMQLIKHLPSNPGTIFTLQNIFNSYDNNVWINIFIFKNNSKYS